MDSMRSLNTSLPGKWFLETFFHAEQLAPTNCCLESRSSSPASCEPRRFKQLCPTTGYNQNSLLTSSLGTSPPKNEHPENHSQLLVAFKAAALSVTQLYKTAAADQKQTRSEGYEDALYELLDFLDKENIGLGDGEGWRIRGWANERLSGRDSVPTEDDDDSGAKQDGRSSPEIQRSHSAPVSHLSPTMRTASPARGETSQPPPPTSAPSDQYHTTPPAFIFQASHAYPRGPEPESDMDMLDSNRNSNDGSAVSHASNPPITVTRPSRTNSRHSNSARSVVRAGSSLTRGAGQKRKNNSSHEYGEFFDILNNKDGFNGGGKRGRFI